MSAIAGISTTHPINIQEWVDTYGKNYVSHAISQENFSKVVTEGALRCSEDLFRSGVEVEYEKGESSSERGVDKMPQLEAEELESLEILSEAEQKLLDELRSKQNELSSQEKEEFRTLRKKLKAAGLNHLSIEEKKYLLKYADSAKCPVISDTYNTFKEIREKYDLICGKREQLGITALTDSEITRYRYFQSKDPLTTSEKCHLRFLERKRKGCGFHFTDHLGWRPSLSEERNVVVRRLSLKYRTSYGAIRLAYDQQRGKTAITYLTRKYEKYIQRGMDQSTAAQEIAEMHNALFVQKLQESIAFRLTTIDWNYGNIAILQGKPEEVVGWKVNTFPYESNEHRSFSYFQNKGTFYRMPLNGKSTLVIGNEKELAPHIARLKELGCAVISTNQLTEAQRIFFKIPKNKS